MAFCYGACEKQLRKVKNNNSTFRENRRSNSHTLLQGVNEFLPVVSKLLKNRFAEIRYKKVFVKSVLFRKNGLGEA
jgi:hypothetical protein